LVKQHIFKPNAGFVKAAVITISSRRPPFHWLRSRQRSRLLMVYYVALPFLSIEGGGLAPGQTVECASGSAAIRGAQTMSFDKSNVGAVAFSRSGDPSLGEFEMDVWRDAVKPALKVHLLTYCFRRRDGHLPRSHRGDRRAFSIRERSARPAWKGRASESAMY
jgi:hypothetical protein